MNMHKSVRKFLNLSLMRGARDLECLQLVNHCTSIAEVRVQIPFRPSFSCCTSQINGDCNRKPLMKTQHTMMFKYTLLSVYST